MHVHYIGCQHDAHAAGCWVLLQWEDDTSIIGQKLGLIPFSSGGNIESSTPMRVFVGSNGQTTANVSGTVVKANNFDFYYFYAMAGPVTLTFQVSCAASSIIVTVLCTRETHTKELLH
jgi:hypothetical protein